MRNDSGSYVTEEAVAESLDKFLELMKDYEKKNDAALATLAVVLESVVDDPKLKEVLKGLLKQLDA